MEVLWKTDGSECFSNRVPVLWSRQEHAQNVCRWDGRVTTHMRNPLLVKTVATSHVILAALSYRPSKRIDIFGVQHRPTFARLSLNSDHISWRARNKI